MTVKTRITFYVVGAGLIASLLFSLVVFFNLIEQPFDILDAVLKETAYRTVEDIVKGQNEAGSLPPAAAASSRYPYWIEVYNESTGALLFQSDLAKLVPLSRIDPGAHKTSTVVFDSEKIRLGQERNGKVAFYIRAFLIPVAGKMVFVQIARPMEKLSEEIRELVLGILTGFVFSIFILIVVSRYVAGRILRPVGAIKDLARDISERNLDQRVPAGEGKDEFSELAKTINRMLDRLQYSFARQREFLFATSHELKTPLTTLRLAADEISRSDSEILPPCARDNLPRLRDQVLRMERLVKDLLNLSALETISSADSKPVHIDEILQSLTEEYRFLADTRRIQMDNRISGPLAVSGDAEKLRRAFSNILDNAVKYNTAGGRIELTGEMVPGGVAVSVSNTGPGVPESELPKVFDQFYRAEKSRSTRHGGSGLGLAIVKRIAELHGGKVTFESREGDWTRVTVFLSHRSTEKS